MRHIRMRAGLAVVALAACGKVEPIIDAAGGGSDGGGDGGGGIDAPVEPVLTVMPLTHQFGPVPVSTSSSPSTFTFTNIGSSPATGCSAPQKSGAHAAEFDIAGDTCGTADLAGGATCTVQLVAKPASAGTRTMTLSRTCTAGGTASTMADRIVVNVRMYAFVTAAETNGALGGLAGADAKCQAAAAAGSVTGPLNKTWKALISQNTGTVVHAKDRFVWTGPVYAMNGVLLVPNPSSWPWSAALTTSQIELTENGAQAGSYAWTGTTVNGTAVAADCNGWTDGTNSFNGRAGETTNISSASWIDSFNNQCDNTFFGLYCISQ